MDKEPTSYLVPRAVFVPVMLSLAAVFIAYDGNAWALLAVPFIILSSLCSAPNLNLANGFLVVVTIAVGLALSKHYPEQASPIVVGAFLGWFISSFEMRLRAKPVYENEKA